MCVRIAERNSIQVDIEEVSGKNGNSYSDSFHHVTDSQQVRILLGGFAEGHPQEIGTENDSVHTG